MNYCPNCGEPVVDGQNFCRTCGLDLRARARVDQAETTSAGNNLRGLGRNSLVYLTPTGLLGLEIQSGSMLFLAVLSPLPLLVAVYYTIQVGALAVYAVAWIAMSLLLYDELKWRRLRSLDGYSPSTPQANKESWLAPWHSIRAVTWNGRTLSFNVTDFSRRTSVTFDRGDAPLVERSLASWGVQYSQRQPRFPRALTRFWALALILFIVSQAILILAATLPFFPGEEQMYNTILNGTRSQVTGVSFFEAFKAIYFNNVQVAWGGMLPILGQLSFGLASYNTGRVLQAIAIGDNYPSSVVLVSLYLLPHTWIEESAYPIATVAGLLAITRWRSVGPEEFTRRLSWGSTKLILTMGGVALILLAAGLIETMGLYLGFDETFLWIPVCVGYYLFVMWNRNQRRSKLPIGSP